MNRMYDVLAGLLNSPLLLRRKVQHPTSPLHPTHFTPPPQGEAGYHKLWDSRCLNYANWEVRGEGVREGLRGMSPVRYNVVDA